LTECVWRGISRRVAAEPPYPSQRQASGRGEGCHQSRGDRHWPSDMPARAADTTGDHIASVDGLTKAACVKAFGSFAPDAMNIGRLAKTLGVSQGDFTG